MHPRSCNSLSKEEWKDSSSPVTHDPFLVCTANPCSTHGTRTPALQGASGNHIPAISPPTPQPPSALSHTAHRPSTSHRQISRAHAVRTRTASIKAHKLASIAWHPALLPGLGLAPGAPTDLRVVLLVEDWATSSTGYLDGAEGGPPDSRPASKPTSGQSKLCFHPHLEVF